MLETYTGTDKYPSRIEEWSPLFIASRAPSGKYVIFSIFLLLKFTYK